MNFYGQCRGSLSNHKNLNEKKTRRMAGLCGFSKFYALRSTINFLISAIALAGLRFFGQALVQFMIV